MNEHLSSTSDDKEVKENDILEDFDYTKLTEEVETMAEYLEQTAVEIAKMKVECAIANIELASTIDGIEIEKEVKGLEKKMKEFMNQTIQDKIEQVEVVEITK